MTTVKDLRNWLAGMPDDEPLAIDDGGLTLVALRAHEGAYIEIGGIPTDEAEED